MYCNKCGKEVDEQAFVCPHCGVKIQKKAENDGPIGCLGVLCFFFPIVGLILYVVWLNSLPQKAKSAGKLALIGFIAGIVGYFLLMMIGLAAG